MCKQKPKVRVDQERARELATVIQSMAVPPPNEEIRPALSDPEIGNFFLLVVSICHQTQTLRGVGARGWDYLQSKLRERVENDKSLIEPATWEKMSSERVGQLLEDPVEGRTLSDPEGRAVLIRNLGQVMKERRWSRLHDLYKESGGFIDKDTGGLASLLGSFKAYDDSVRKKTMLLLGIVRSMLGWKFKDPQNLRSPVDYHEVRGHLRIGTVRIEDSELERKVWEGVPVSDKDDVAIRSAVSDAISQIAGQPGLPDAMTLHYLFWYLFRHVCDRTRPFCVQCPKDLGLPTKYDTLVELNGVRRCPFVQACEAYGLGRKMYKEHQLAGSTHWY